MYNLLHHFSVVLFLLMSLSCCSLNNNDGLYEDLTSKSYTVNFPLKFIQTDNRWHELEITLLQDSMIGSRDHIIIMQCPITSDLLQSETKATLPDLLLRYTNIVSVTLCKKEFEFLCVLYSMHPVLYTIYIRAQCTHSHTGI